jgi:hypothetical protein
MTKMIEILGDPDPIETYPSHITNASFGTWEKWVCGYWWILDSILEYFTDYYHLNGKRCQNLSTTHAYV